MIRKLLSAIAFAGLVLCAAQPAAASTISFDVTFTAAGFTSSFGTGATAPVPVFLGHFGLAFDTSASSSAGSVTVDFIDPVAFGPVSFDYNAVTDSLLIGATSPGSVFPGFTDFALTINQFTGASPTFGFFTYALDSVAGDIFTTSTGLVHVKQTVVPVATTPLPAALPLFAAALGGLGLFGWRRRKTAAA